MSGLTVRNLQYKEALDAVLFNAKQPRILHLATHGYFLNDEEAKSPDDTRGMERTIGVMQKDGFGVGGFGKTVVASKMENPMLRSGIALAGANTSIKEGRDEGVVSAEKILGLNLKGTELVVLSACETGVGDVMQGEGVFGLKRSFILSGAKTVVMSLWSVPSAETTELMSEFYTMTASGIGKAEAINRARLRMMAKNPNPFFWGAFVLTGKPD
jgi:CHAT domain-containing protein